MAGEGGSGGNLVKAGCWLVREAVEHPPPTKLQIRKWKQPATIIRLNFVLAHGDGFLMPQDWNYGRTPGLCKLWHQGSAPGGFERYGRFRQLISTAEFRIARREEPALRQRLRQVEFRELWRPKPRIWSMNEWELNASSQSAGQFCGGCLLHSHLYAQGLWHLEGPSTHSTRFVVSKQRDFPGA